MNSHVNGQQDRNPATEGFRHLYMFLMLLHQDSTTSDSDAHVDDDVFLYDYTYTHTWREEWTLQIKNTRVVSTLSTTTTNPATMERFRETFPTPLCSFGRNTCRGNNAHKDALLTKLRVSKRTHSIQSREHVASPQSSI